MVQRSLRMLRPGRAPTQECRNCPLYPYGIQRYCMAVRCNRGTPKLQKPRSLRECSSTGCSQLLLLDKSLYQKLGLKKQAERLSPSKGCHIKEKEWNEMSTVQARSDGCLCTSCVSGCPSCSGGCSGDCDGSVLAAAMDVQELFRKLQGAVPDVPKLFWFLQRVVPVPVRNLPKQLFSKLHQHLYRYLYKLYRNLFGRLSDKLSGTVRQTPAPPTVKQKSSLTLGTTSPLDTLSWPWIIPSLKTRDG